MEGKKTVSRLQLGRMLSHSKTAYMQRFPKHLVAFNANVLKRDGTKVWYGDVDLDVDGDALRAMALSEGETLYVFREHDARFEAPDWNRWLAKITASDIERRS
jgi:hypothetical protein